MTATAQAPTTQDAQPRIKVTNKVLGELRALQKNGRIDLPPNYSVANAMNSAWLVLQDTKDKAGRSVLQVCTEASIVNALRNMAYLGLSVAKTQCYFIAYGKELTLFVSYWGKIAIAKRVDPRIEDVTAGVIYQGDRIVTARKNGYEYVAVHEHEWGNEDPAKLAGAYCTIIYKNGAERSTLMNMDQIRKCWSFGQTNGKSKAHMNTPDQMAMRTVINRALKPIINTSDDATILGQVIREVEMDEAKAEAKETVRDRTNVVDVDFESVPEPEPSQNATPGEIQPAAVENLTIDPQTGEVVEMADLAAEPLPFGDPEPAAAGDVPF